MISIPAPLFPSSLPSSSDQVTSINHYTKREGRRKGGTPTHIITLVEGVYVLCPSYYYDALRKILLRLGVQKLFKVKLTSTCHVRKCNLLDGAITQYKFLLFGHPGTTSTAATTTTAREEFLECVDIGVEIWRRRRRRRGPIALCVCPCRHRKLTYKKEEKTKFEPLPSSFLSRR